MSIVKVVNAIPSDHSDEQNQDSEPSIAVNPNNPSEIVLTAFTPPDNGKTGGPLYYSSDGGSTWYFYFDVPGGEPGDQSIGFAGVSNELYTAVLRGDIFKQLAVSRTDNPPVDAPLPALDPRSDIDQPWVETRTVIGGTDNGKDRLYVGYNNDGAGVGNPSATIDVCLDALAGSPTFTPVLLEHRTVGSGLLDGYAIRPAAHYDGTVYAVYEGWRSGSFGANITTDIVVARDDNWGNGSPPFQALTDPDTKPGRIVQSGVVINDGGVLGQERLNNDLAIAVDPTNSNIVYIAWADNAGPNYTLRVRRSVNRGVGWSGDLLTVDNATMACLAISIAGQVGLMYQQVNGANWETHLRRTTDSSGMNWNDLTLSVTPSGTPAAMGQPYLGDWARIVAVGRTFYGVFCANNTPDPANFPQGVSFPRNHTTSAPFHLLGNDDTTVIPVSIDPFFFSVTDLDPASDFYVRDWTDSISSGDNGAEPSTHPDFFSTSDVWNQYSSNVAFSPNSSDQILGENASSGSGSGAVNYAFARIRRNVLPASGSGPVSVSAHFLVSEFGTGSNFSDWVFADPSDPDVTFPVESDVSVSFGDTELGPKITPPYQWNLGPTASNHLCLAVEIASPGDPFASPGLTGHAPGASDISVVNDNNKAQHNLQVYNSGHGSHGATYYGIVHNAGLETRDMVLQVGGAGQRVPSGATLEIVTAKGAIEKRPWRPWEQITLAGMLPGENRWLGVTIPTPAGSDAPVPVTIFEIRQNLVVNGFTIAAQPAPASDVISANLIFHQSVFARLHAGFGVAAATAEVSAAAAFPGGATHHRKHHDDDQGLNIEQDVSVTSQGMKIEVHLRITGHPEDRIHKPAAPHASATSYESFIEGRVSNILECFKTLLKTVSIADAFGIAGAISTLQAAAGDEATLLTAHATLLHKLDAFMTMLQKANGDRADILQNVLWQIRLYTTSSVLSAFAEAANIVSLSRAYAAAVEARTARIGDYSLLLAGLSALFDQTASHLPGLNLQPLINDIVQASSAREQQRAHRQFLLHLQAAA